MDDLLSRDELLAAKKRRYLLVSIPELGGRKVRIRNLTERERSNYETEVLSKKGTLHKELLNAAKRRLIVMTSVDKDGNQNLTDADVQALEDVDGAVTGRIYDEARKHCGFEEGDIEALVKNSDRVAVDGSQ